ncbi:MAG: DUF4062 domain-containing protein [Verrucomicrobia bacterium]|nr:MAG: DUF4062 domain-containing protein [Verrucomicrobiota bacterium]TAE85160.1 MAG: DUF4062 domain-containing protein [Verrucomicrobiota bacterium]TAF40038.1 MAG: DUF4062 domain-containing protein [Verrucomicrobiota bacterium]
MAAPKVFISSTCFDLNVARSQLRLFVSSLGYEPVMSDYMDVLYDPRIHTHTSCLKEIPNCDLVVLIIGSRFGGKGIPESISQLDFEKLKELSKSSGALENPQNLSITQLEILGALSEGVPIFAFVDSRVLHDHELYEKNKNSKIIDEIKFPSIEKPETAKFIFEFINFLRHRLRGNGVFSYARYEEIEQTLKRHWASWYQRLLWEQRKSVADQRQIDNMADQLEALKTAILAAIPNTDAREGARAVVRFRSLIDVLLCFEGSTAELLEQNIDFDSLLKKLSIASVQSFSQARRSRPATVFVRTDGFYYESRLGSGMGINRLSNEWENFRELKLDTKRIVIETTQELGGVRLLSLSKEKFCDAVARENAEKDNIQLVSLADLIAQNLDD